MLYRVLKKNQVHLNERVVVILKSLYYMLGNSLKSDEVVIPLVGITVREVDKNEALGGVPLVVLLHGKFREVFFDDLKGDLLIGLDVVGGD